MVTVSRSSVFQRNLLLSIGGIFLLFAMMDANHFRHREEYQQVDVVQIVRSILDDTALSLQQKGIAARLTMPQQVIIAAIQEYANMVSIGRLGLNDHGPVHMKTVCRNALKMLSLLHTAGMQTSLEKENIGTFADSIAAVMLASLLHDSGMTIGWKGHELYSGIISYPIIGLSSAPSQ